MVKSLSGPNQRTVELNFLAGFRDSNTFNSQFRNNGLAFFCP